MCIVLKDTTNQRKRQHDSNDSIRDCCEWNSPLTQLAYNTLSATNPRTMRKPDRNTRGHTHTPIGQRKAKSIQSVGCSDTNWIISMVRGKHTTYNKRKNLKMSNQPPYGGSARLCLRVRISTTQTKTDRCVIWSSVLHNTESITCRQYVGMSTEPPRAAVRSSLTSCYRIGCNDLKTCAFLYASDTCVEWLRSPFMCVCSCIHVFKQTTTSVNIGIQYDL